MSNPFIESLYRSIELGDAEKEKIETFHRSYGGKIPSILVSMGYATDEQVAKSYAEFYQLQYVDHDNFELTLEGLAREPATEQALNYKFLKQHQWLLLGWQGDEPLFITTDPLNWDVVQYLSLQSCDYKTAICVENVFRDIQARTLDAEQENALSGELGSDVDAERLREMASEAPIINLVNSLVSRGVQRRASDMHIEPHKGMCRVRLRIDGVLQDLEYLPFQFYLPIVSRIKILSGMDIAEKRRPQDGKISMRVAAIELDIRVSALPLNEGESIVMRFLLKQSISYELETLGISDDILDNIATDLTKTAGVILLTGPTGSGKTTSLYSFLNQINSEGVKIITLEDPVEYQLEGVNQIQVNADIGFDFARGLRSIVRQDPDIIMLGEIRDKETAQIAMQSSLTGHLVFSTVHTNDAPGAFTRLLDLGVEEFLLNAALVSVIAQRLARTICTDCAVPLPEAEQEKVLSQYPVAEIAKNFGLPELKLQKGQGCKKCAGTGYRGRVAILEYLRCDDHIKQLPKGADFLAEAQKHMERNNIRNLFQDGLLKVAQGVTTIDEVIRVAG